MCASTSEKITLIMTSSNGNLFRDTGPLCGGRWPVDSPHKGQWRGALMFSLIWACTNGWVNNQDASDLRRHLALYDKFIIIANARFTSLPSLKSLLLRLSASRRLCLSDFFGLFPRHGSAVVMMLVKWLQRECFRSVGSPDCAVNQIKFRG